MKCLRETMDITNKIYSTWYTGWREPRNVILIRPVCTLSYFGWDSNTVISIECGLGESHVSQLPPSPPPPPYWSNHLLDPWNYLSATLKPLSRALKPLPWALKPLPRALKLPPWLWNNLLAPITLTTFVTSVNIRYFFHFTLEERTDLILYNHSISPCSKSWNVKCDYSNMFISRYNSYDQEKCFNMIDKPFHCRMFKIAFEFHFSISWKMALFIGTMIYFE